ncbi:phosphosulfolactate phosphohydrolase [Serinibacter arcticus]|uniref:Probable 2-phosphosulfolactate phosphatase n=1 Tax=Serinibacter arcticus TaxID=1655435 RepID=A0A2U1ZVB1_9MICO|nr:2-phosphosulfolactate phosphatase [Serinibacter arcticus]PWD50883.1 phosphosulfolactate phosphohydrolase [Serinibacter arcticus]
MTEQADYQVRLAWGAAGLARLAPADVVVVVDVLDDATRELAAAASTGGAVVLRADLTNAAAVATACLAIQHERASRTSIAVVAAGDGGAFSSEDLLGAGAVVAALSERGTDHTSPEAAVACEAFAGLRRAVVHLVSASVAGRALAADGRGDEVAAAARLDSSTAVPRWSDGDWSPAPPA